MYWKKYFLKPSEETEINSLIEAFEQKTGAELLVVVAKASDPYPAASLRFAILASFLLTVVSTFLFEFSHIAYIPFFNIVLLAGMLIIARLNRFKALALSRIEMERETDEKASEMFYILSSSKVEHNLTCLLYLSLLERKIHLKVDSQLKTKIPENELKTLIEKMSLHFKEENFAQGLKVMIEQFENKVKQAFPEPFGAPPNKLENKIEWVNFS